MCYNGYESNLKTRAEALEVTWDRPADPDWHPIAVRLYGSAYSSGGSKFWQDSDWALFWSLCDDLSYIKHQGARRSSEMLKGVYAALGSLLLTEGDRRKSHVELQRTEQKARLASVAAIDDYATQLGVDD